jgi:RNA polymerase sigma-70 factor (ECF subfamily)
MNSYDDIIYIEQVLNGRINAFSHIVDHHKTKAYNLAFRICGNAEDAEEIAQDAFLKAFRSLSLFRKDSSFATWLYRIVFNTAVSHVRLRKQNYVSLEEFPPDATNFIGENPSEEISESEHRKTIINFALLKLNEEERGIISLYYYEEMTMEEIADVTGISRANIKVKLFRTRQKMLEVILKAEKKKMSCHEF